MSKASLAVVLLASASTSPAGAQAVAQTDIVVTGAGLSHPSGDAAYDVATIDRARIESEASGRLEDLLRDVAGFAQYRRSDARSAQPTSQGATLRGLGGNASSRALVLLDGVPQSDPFGGWISWPALDPRRLGLIRVTRGGGSGAFGPGALAGTIELESAGPDELAPLWGDLAYGSRNALDADLGVSSKLGGGFAFLSARYARGDGFVPLTPQTRGPIDERAPYRQGNVTARAVFPVASDVELQANGLWLYDHRTRGLPGTPNETRGFDASVRLIGRGGWGFEALGYLQTRTFSSGFASANASRTIATQSLDQYAVPGTGIGGRLELRPPRLVGIDLRLGTDARQTDGQTEERVIATGLNRVAGGRTDTLGGYAEASARPIDGVTLTAGGRIDRWWIEDGRLATTPVGAGGTKTTRYPDRAGWRPTARAGIAWKPGAAIRLRSAAYLGWRLPTLNELYRPFRVGNDSTLANPLLRPERLKGVDGGVDWDPLPALHIGATLFWNRLEDAIGNVTQSIDPVSGGRTLLRDNLDAVVSRGAELDARLNYGDWRLLGSYSLADARVRGGATSGLRPAQTPEHQASGTIAWAPPRRFNASLTLRYIGAQFEDDQNSLRLHDALTLDATASLPVGRGFTLEARAENLTNALIEATRTATTLERAQPRTLWFGVRYGG